MRSCAKRVQSTESRRRCAHPAARPVHIVLSPGHRRSAHTTVIRSAPSPTEPPMQSDGFTSCAVGRGTVHYMGRHAQ
eukprot:981801-Prymnesium_polylepis.1